MLVISITNIIHIIELFTLVLELDGNLSTTQSNVHTLPKPDLENQSDVPPPAASLAPLMTKAHQWGMHQGTETFSRIIMHLFSVSHRHTQKGDALQ